MSSRNDANHPHVSVVLPTYERPAMLAAAVESVAAQTYDDVELIVVDDASSTPAREVLAGETFDGLQLRHLRHDTNRGANAARNSGIEAATGDIVAFIDDDDRWHPEKLAAQVELFDQGGEDVGVTLVGQKYVSGGEVTTVAVPGVGGDGATRGLLEGETAAIFSAIAVRRSAIDAAGLPDERFPSWQDREWLVRLSNHCRFAVDPRPLVTKRNGTHTQIADDFESKRDVSYPLFREKHRELAADLDRETEFLVTMTNKLAHAALQNGFEREARRLAIRTIRLDPTTASAWGCLLLSLTGPNVYRSAVTTKRTAAQLRRRLPL